jgi:carbon monoxide dehydrogenase subunit G
VLIENSFSVPAHVDHVWAYLLDVERVAPCMPGAELTETVDDRTWKGKVNMKLGPVSLSFAGTVTMQERDDDARRVVLAARGMEQRGKGAANATVTSWLEPGEGSTDVKMEAEIHLTGTVAQLSRGLLPEVSRKLTAEFAECLRASMQAAEAPAGAEPAAAVTGPAAGGMTGATAGPAAGGKAKPISGIRLGLAAIWAWIRNLVRQLFGTREG